MTEGSPVCFRCPFCGGACEAVDGDDAEDAEDAEALGVFHARPVCPQFVELDALEFLAAVNDADARALGPAAVAELQRIRAGEKDN